MCVRVSACPHTSVPIFTRVCVDEVSLTNLTNDTLFLNTELLHFGILTDVPVLVFVANYVKKYNKNQSKSL